MKRTDDEWFERDAQGNAVHHGEDPRLFRTCMFSTYMTDYMPAIMKEVNSLYPVDAMYTNGWPPNRRHRSLVGVIEHNATSGALGHRSRPMIPVRCERYDAIGWFAEALRVISVRMLPLSHSATNT